MTARIGVLVFPGSCDEADTYAAIEQTEGTQGEFLWHADRDLKGVDAVVVPGGFSYGDYLRAGAIARLSPVMEAVGEFARSGGPVLGICNGFQVLCEAELLPGALLPNTALRFVCRQVDVRVENDGTPFTRACAKGEILSLPVKHTSGRYFAPPELLDEMESADQIILRYVEGNNPNGSLNDIAGVANRRKNVLGLMPHPEHAVDLLTGSSDGARILRSLSEHCHVTVA